jgi:hypothetical protein
MFTCTAVPECSVGTEPAQPAAETSLSDEWPCDVADQDDWPLDGCGP